MSTPPWGDAEGPIRLQDCQVHGLKMMDPLPSQQGCQLVPGQEFPVKVWLDDFTVADEHGRNPFHPSSNGFEFEAQYGDAPADDDQNQSQNHPPCKGVISPIHGVLNRI